ncbi:MAG: hypothetical protein CMH81_03130 [Nitrospiraceae bacterium]|nr:hypothetical protein [Nitrospiraceae bacterium]
MCCGTVMQRRHSDSHDRGKLIVASRISGFIVLVLSLLLCFVPPALATVYALHIQDDVDGGFHESLYVIVVAEAPDENVARMMAFVIQEVVRRPLHLYRGDDRVMIVLTGHPISLADAEIIGRDLKYLALFQDTPYPRFHPVQSIDYCDQTRRCLDISESNQDQSRADI